MKRKLVFLLTVITLLLSSCDPAGGLASLETTRPAVTTKEPTATPSVTAFVTSSILPTTEPITTVALITTAPTATSAEITTVPAATSTEITTAPAATEDLPASPSDGTSPILVSMTETVSRGNQATVTIKGEPDKIYTITVYYPSSISTAKGLEPKAADGNGEVSWTWKIGSRTSEGTHRIVITDGKEPLTLYITVTS